MLLSFQKKVSIRRLITKLNYGTGSKCGKDQSERGSEEGKKAEQQKTSNEALQKLKKLLEDMTEETMVTSKVELDLAKPVNRKLKKNESNDYKKTPTTNETASLSAAKKLATSLGDRQTQSELLEKLLTMSKDTKSPTNNIKDVIREMKVETEKPHTTKADQVRNALKDKLTTSRIPSPATTYQPMDLFESEPLRIFTDESTAEYTYGVENKVWDQLYKSDLKLTLTHPPANYFQQMILWTEQGKLWKFPIDNEQELMEEKQVYFADHVFLEKHLEPWCPPKGPLRHFMELVCVGLSKNPYLTVDAKKRHINWFKEYFNDKRALMLETGAFVENPK